MTSPKEPRLELMGVNTTYGRTLQFSRVIVRRFFSRCDGNRGFRLCHGTRTVRGTVTDVGPLHFGGRVDGVGDWAAIRPGECPVFSVPTSQICSAYSSH